MALKGKTWISLFIKIGRILKCTQISELEHYVHEFESPTLHFKADNYINLIECQSVTHTEPPLKLSISDSELPAVMLGIPAEINVLGLPCNSQAL